VQCKCCANLACFPFVAVNLTFPRGQIRIRLLVATDGFLQRFARTFALLARSLGWVTKSGVIVALSAEFRKQPAILPAGSCCDHSEIGFGYGVSVA
jgi:hypothetical protein